MNLDYTVFLYGTDSDGDPDVYVVHVTSNARSIEEVIKAARLEAAKELEDDQDEGFNIDDWKRFEGKNPFVCFGHIQELHRIKG